MKRSTKPEVHAITGARSGLSEDVSGRTRRYLVSMGVRTLCVLGAAVVGTRYGIGIAFWIMLAGAVFLPYIAVVVANAGRESGGGDGPAPIPPEAHRTLGGPGERDLPGIDPGSGRP
jgi:hypothetical protein